MNQVPTTMPGSALIPDTPQSLASTLVSAEINTQITTAKAYPRGISKCVQNMVAMVAMDEESARECIFAKPQGKEIIKGPSVRLAEIIANEWGNNRVSSRVTHLDRAEKYIEAEGVFHDLENNSACLSRVRRSIATREGNLYPEHMIATACNALCSIAKRNAILSGVPRSIWRQAYEMAEKIIRGDDKTISKRRELALKFFEQKYNISRTRIFASLEIDGLEDIGPDQLVTLQGMRAALTNDEITLDELFPNGKGTKSAMNPGKSLDTFMANLKTETGAGSSPTAPQAAEDETNLEVSSNKSADSAGDGDVTTSSPASEPVAFNPITEARERGYRAYMSKQSFKAVPPVYRATGNEEKARAWQEGWKMGESADTKA